MESLPGSNDGEEGFVRLQRYEDAEEERRHVRLAADDREALDERSRSRSSSSSEDSDDINEYVEEWLEEDADLGGCRG